MTIVGGMIFAWIGVTVGIALRRAGRALFIRERPVQRTPVRGAFPVLPARHAASSSPPLMVDKIRRFRVVGVDATKNVTKVIEEPRPPAASDFGMIQ